MIFVIYRHVTDTVQSIIFGFSGVASLDLWAPFTFTSNEGIFVDGGFPDPSIPTGGEPYRGSGITLRDGLTYGHHKSLVLLAHEYGHFLIGSGDPTGSYGLMGGVYSPSMSALERQQLGYMSILDGSNATDTIPDYLTSTSKMAYRVSIAGSNEYFLVENHQKLSIYDGVGGIERPPADRGKGLYIFHVVGGLPYVECADGRWNWHLDCRPTNPFDSLHTVNVWSRVEANPNSGLDEIRRGVDWPEGKCFLSTNDYTGDSHGDNEDAYRIGYNQLFSPSTNPNSNTTGGACTAIQIELLSETSGIYTIRASTLPPPGPPVLASPSSGATNVSTSPTLSWNASSGATSYSLQVSTISSFSTTVVNQTGITTTSYAVSGLANNTTYYWRVNASNACKPGDWSSTWSFTTVPPPPPAVALASPPDATGNVPLNPTMAWHPFVGAISYHLQISKFPSFTPCAVDQVGITDTSYNASGLEYITGYYWRVNASNASGEGAWSASWYFTTVLPPPPPAPTLVYPANGAMGVSTSPTLSWNASSGATSYRLQVSTNTSFSPTVFDQSGITTTSYAVSGLADTTTYYWHVNATNANGTSGWSGRWSFKTMSSGVPAPPTLLSPPNGATGVPINPTLSWNASSGASTYGLEVSTSPSFSTFVVAAGTISTSYNVSGLAYQTTFYWRVNAMGATGASSDWSAVWSFTTVQPPPCGSPSPPAWVTASRNLPGRIELSWGDASAPCGIAGYNVYRRSHCGTTWTLVTYVQFSSTSWVDYPPPNCGCMNRYDYKVTTVDSYARESGPSQEVVGKMAGNGCQ